MTVMVETMILPSTSSFDLLRQICPLGLLIRATDKGLADRAMPTTRNKWQLETQKSSSSESKQTKPESHDAAATSTGEKTFSAATYGILRLAAPVQEQNTEKRASPELPEQTDDVGLDQRSPKRRKVMSPDASQQARQASEMASPVASRPEPDFNDIDPLIPANTRTATSNPAHGSPVQRPPDIPAAPKPPPSGPSQQTRLDNLPILSNLSSQLLSVLAKMSPTEALQLSRAQASQTAREYQFIRSLFNPVRDLFLKGSPFFSPIVLGLTDPDQVEILRKANQAMYMSSIFTGEIGLRDMDQNFLEVFVPEQGKLLKAQGSIYLELKTQAFITANRTGHPQPLAVMAELFPPDVESNLLDRRPGVKGMAPSEQDFLKRLYSRRDILLADVRNKTLDQLPFRYRWEDLSREVSGYLAKNFGPATNNPANTADGSNSQASSMIASQPQSHLQGEFSIHEPPMAVAPTCMPPAVPIPTHSTTPPLLDMDDFVAQAARAAEIAMQGPAAQFEPPQPSKPAAPEPTTHSKIDPQFQHYTPGASNGSASRAGPFPPGHDEIPHSSQTAPTHVLYERARQAATAKASPPTRKPVTPSQRRPWTPEEEAALMTGLDQVKGPHWSQILAMYGPGGTINESLKDRNQVQLKDKARNLKLFFLKAGIEVPYYLKYVTGDLKTRAPGQAERQEARERERLQNEDQRAHFDGLQGIMALASATQTPGDSDSSATSPFDTDEALEGEGEATMQENADEVAGEELNDIESMIARAAAQASESMPRA
jgi:protein TBF1